jgi:hypothetical protein
MKSIALVPMLLLVFACASSTSLNDDEVLDCAPGREIEILAGIEGVNQRQSIAPGEELAFLVEVANNSHEDVTVDAIRIEPRASARGTSDLDPVYQTVKYDLAAGKDHLFRFPVRRRLNPAMDSRSASGIVRESPEMTVTVLLTNGNAYRCSFGLAR